ncbi:TetR/AcrR family transcriptional regulator [Nocardioides bigeumensis]|uniref:HTH tetR-type domain-containing protein n=1 Tax=Nocardioides bigeumensis TaxID=433657 RepID=A0ABN2XWI3_9ACTN
MSQAETGGRRTAIEERRRKQAADIIAATRALFDERGVRDAQVEDIARAAGVNRAILYRHFTGKEEIFALVVVSYLGELGEQMSAAVAGHDTARARLTALVEAFVDYGIAHPAFADCAQALMRLPGPELLAEVSERALGRLGRAISSCLVVLSDTLEHGVATDEFTIEDPQLLANAFYASGLGALQLARVGILVKEAAPGVPGVGAISPGQVRDYLVASALAMATGRDS